MSRTGKPAIYNLFTDKIQVRAPYPVYGVKVKVSKLQYNSTVANHFVTLRKNKEVCELLWRKTGRSKYKWNFLNFEDCGVARRST